MAVKENSDTASNMVVSIFSVVVVVVVVSHHHLRELYKT
jgi:hypothetical protein